MMTTCAAILGAVPLAIGFGEGAEMRQPLGVVAGITITVLTPSACPENATPCAWLPDEAATTPRIPAGSCATVL